MVLEMHRNTSSGVLEDTAPTLLSEEVVSRLRGDLDDQSKSVTLQKDRNSTDTFPSPQPSGTVTSMTISPQLSVMSKRSRHILLPAFQPQAAPREQRLVS